MWWAFYFPPFFLAQPYSAPNTLSTDPRQELSGPSCSICLGPHKKHKNNPGLSSSDGMGGWAERGGLQTLRGEQHAGLLPFHVPWKQAQGIRQLKRMF